MRGAVLNDMTLRYGANQVMRSMAAGLRLVAGLFTIAAVLHQNPALAISSSDRARVFVSVDITEVIAQFFGNTVLRNRALEAVSAGPSANAPVGRDYQDVVLSFFNPEDCTRATASITIVVDVTDVNPRFVTLRELTLSRSARI